MRKSLLLFLVLFLALVCSVAAADTEYALGDISGKMSLNEDVYIVLTPENLAAHPDLLSELGVTAEELQKDWETRGVILKAWTKDKKTSVEVSVIQDEDSKAYYDLETQAASVRKQYYKDQLAAYKNQGYNVSDSEMKLHAKSGHYVVFDYVIRSEDTARRGVLRKTIRNGYTLTVDYEVFDRRPTKTDRDKGRKIINTIKIDAVAPVAEAPSGKQGTASGSSAAPAAKPAPSGAEGTLSVSVPPPEETNDGVFTIEGTAYPGSKLVIVAMRWSGGTYQFHADASKNGKFKSKITLKDEGLYQFTINMMINDQPVADQVLNTVTYSKSLLPVSLDQKIPEEIQTDELVISGVTVKNVSIQCLATNGNYTYDKSVKTNGTGKFKFKVPTTAEGEYNIILSFQKKGLNSQRKTFTTTRTASAKTVQKNTSAKAVHPAYNLLTKKLNSYIGKTLVYTVYITEVNQVGDEWIIKAAMKLSKGVYSNFLIFVAKEDPGLAVGTKVKLYGTCFGAYEVLAEEGNTSYPGLDYLFSN